MSSRAAWVRSGVMAGDLGCTHISTGALSPPIAHPLQKWKNTARAAAGRAPGELEISMAAAELPPREAMEFDVVIVGAGPAGLAAAIRLKQIAPDLSVVVVEKGSEVGAHILSGAVIDPVGLDRLLPEWRAEDTPMKTAVAADRFYML